MTSIESAKLMEKVFTYTLRPFGGKATANGSELTATVYGCMAVMTKGTYAIGMASLISQVQSKNKMAVKPLHGVQKAVEAFRGKLIVSALGKVMRYSSRHVDKLEMLGC